MNTEDQKNFEWIKADAWLSSVGALFVLLFSGFEKSLCFFAAGMLLSSWITVFDYKLFRKHFPSGPKTTQTQKPKP